MTRRRRSRLPWLDRHDPPKVEVRKKVDVRKKEDEVADSFASRVVAAVVATGPLCAGIDPSAALLASWGLRDDPSGLRSFGATCVEAFAGTVGVIKPQVAFFERHGAWRAWRSSSGSLPMPAPPASS